MRKWAGCAFIKVHPVADFNHMRLIIFRQHIPRVYKQQQFLPVPCQKSILCRNALRIFFLFCLCFRFHHGRPSGICRPPNGKLHAVLCQFRLQSFFFRFSCPHPGCAEQESQRNQQQEQKPKQHSCFSFSLSFCHQNLLSNL